MQQVADRDQAVVDLHRLAGTAHVGVNVESKIQRGGPVRQNLHITLGRKNVYTLRKKFALEIGQELDRAGRVAGLQRLAHLSQPIVKSVGAIAQRHGTFVFPVGGEAPLGNLVHALRADLHLHIAAFRTDHGRVQRFVAVGLRVGHPVFQSLRNGFVLVGYDHVNMPAQQPFFGAGRRFHDDANGKKIVNVLERDVLRTNFIPDGIDALRSPGDTGLYVQLLQRFLQRLGEGIDVCFAGAFGLRQLLGDVVVLVRVADFQANILELGFYRIQSQPMGQGCVNGAGFCSYFQLFRRRHTADSAQVMQPVRHFYQHHPHIEQHRFQHFADVLSLRAFLILHLVELSQSFHDARHPVAELLPNRVQFDGSIFHHVVHERAGRRSRPQPQLLHADTGHLDGVENIWLSRLTALLAMRIAGQVERIVHDLFVRRAERCFESMHQLLESRLDLCLFLVLYGQRYFFL